MPESLAVLRRVGEILSIRGDRVGKARRIAAAIRESGEYGWVGIYDVTPDEIAVVAWSGLAPSTARSEIDVPVLDHERGTPVGLLRVESDLPDAFGAEDRSRLEECAAALAPFWT
jgi:putative methionine-R-sulfoxide reductase with GAF domain